MTDESRLRERAREALQAGKVPNHRVTGVWAGQGCGGYCAICSDLLKPDELEYELEFAGNSNGCSLRDYHMHIECFAAWERERENFGRVSGGIASDALPSSDNEATIAQRERKTYRDEGVP